jgi:hypothetical protein
MSNLTSLERRILALLEEAGEHSLGGLINSVSIPKGRPEELKAVAKALRTLLKNDLVSIGYLLLPVRTQTTILRASNKMSR